MDVYRLEADGRHTEGVVTRVNVERRSGSPSGQRGVSGSGSHTVQIPVVRFRDGETEVEVEVHNRWADRKFAVGQNVPLVYPPGDPGAARIPSFAEFYLVPLVFGGVGLLVDGLVVLLLVLPILRRRRRSSPGGAAVAAASRPAPE